jgi:hypothetical protein
VDANVVRDNAGEEHENPRTYEEQWSRSHQSKITTHYIHLPGSIIPTPRR